MALRIISVSMGNLTLRKCLHSEVHEIGQDCDEDEKLLRLIRCQRCSLLMCEYLPIVNWNSEI